MNNRFSIEFPGGGINNGTPKRSALKELIEETGYEGKLKFVGFFNPFSGATDEFCYVFIANKLKRSKIFLPDETEQFKLLRYTKKEIDEMIFSNEIFSGMTMAAWVLARNKIFNN